MRSLRRRGRLVLPRGRRAEARGVDGRHLRRRPRPQSVGRPAVVVVVVVVVVTRARVEIIAESKSMASSDMF